MPSVLCVLHSSTGTYAPALLGEATRCLTALHHALQSGAPDFVPSLFYVSRADPQAGPQCLYASQVPDSNHAVLVEGPIETGHTSGNSSNVVYAPFATADDDGSGAAAAATPSQLLYGALQHRSPSLMLRSVCAGVRRRPTAEGSASASGSDRHPLSSLAGALLTALCYYQRHAAAHSEQQQQQQQQGGADGPASRALLLVFTDYEGPAASAPTAEDVPFSTECALAAAALLAAPPADRQEAATAAGAAAVRVLVYGRGAARSPHLRALAASTAGGWVRGHSAPSDLGAMLHFRPAGGEGGEGGEGEEGRGAARRGAKRARVVDHYVLAPATLPAVPAPATRQRAEGHRASHLGWLCPRCMTVMHRSLAEATAAPAEGSKTPAHTCPYCLEG